MSDLLYCAQCCQSVPPTAFPSKPGRRVKWKLTHGSLVCKACVAEHFPDCVDESELAEYTDNSPSLSACATSSTAASETRSSPFFSTSNSPKACNSPPGTPTHFGHGTHAYEVKAQRLKPTKKQLRLAAGGGRVEGNPLFVDLLHWLRDIEALPFTRLTALIEDDLAPALCRLHTWGLSCNGCNYFHSEQTLQLWNRKQRATKAPSWMRSPPHLPSLSAVPFIDVNDFWTEASEDSKNEWGRKVQFVTCDGIVVWGRDLGEDGLQIFRAFIQDIELGEACLDSFELPPPAIACVAWPSDIWQRVLTFLSVREEASAGIAILASSDVAAAADDAWDPSILLPGLSISSAPGLRSFLAMARAAVLGARVFAALPRSAGIVEPCVWESDIVAGCKPAQRVPTAAPACALSLSSGLLAIAMDSNVKLIRRSDLRSCGALGLRGFRRISQVALTDEGQTIALAVQDHKDRCLKPEVCFYTTSDVSEAPRIVQLPCNAEVSGLYFLPDTTCEYSVVSCGSSLCYLSAETGDVVHIWSEEPQKTFTSCQVAGPHSVVSASDGIVQLWDLRVPTVATHTVITKSCPSALCMFTQSSSSWIPDALVGATSGELSRLDWRVLAMQACGSLPVPIEFLSLAPNSALLSVGAGSMHIGYCGGEYVNMKSSVNSLVVAAAASSSAWALASQAQLRSGRPEVAVVELEGLGSGGFRQCVDPCIGATISKKPPKMFRKFEGNPHSQHAGKTGRSNRRRGR